MGVSVLVDLTSLLAAHSRMSLCPATRSQTKLRLTKRLRNFCFDLKADLRPLLQKSDTVVFKQNLLLSTLVRFTGAPCSLSSL